MHRQGFSNNVEFDRCRLHNAELHRSTSLCITYIHFDFPYLSGNCPAASLHIYCMQLGSFIDAVLSHGLPGN